MASRVLSIEINQVVTKVCEMDAKGKAPRVYKNFMIDTPEDVVADGVLTINEGYVTALKKALAANKARAKKVVFTISSGRIASREVTIPYVKANKIDEVIEAKAEEYFPVDLADYKITHTVLGLTEDEKGNKRYKVMVLAVPLKLLQGYYDLAAACGLEIQAIDYMGNSLFQAVKNSCVEGTQLVAKIDEHSTVLMVVQEGVLVSIRSIGYGVNEAIQVVANEESGDFYEGGSYLYEEAITSLRQSEYIQAEVTEEDSAVVRSVSDALEQLVNSIGRVIDYHNPKSNGHPIERMYITGLGGSFKGMSELIQERLGVPVSLITDIDGVVVPKNFDVLSLGDYVACIGAVMGPLDLLLTSKKNKKQKERNTSDADSSGLAILLAVGGVIVAIVLAVTAILPYKEAQRENKRMLARIEALKPVEEVHNMYLATQTLWLDAESMQELTENHNDNLVAFIEELEQRMPADIVVLSLSANADTVNLNINVSSKESAAKVIQELSAFETIQIVQTAQISDVKNSEDVHVVSFSVNCTYARQPEAAE